MIITIGTSGLCPTTPERWSTNILDKWDEQRLNTRRRINTQKRQVILSVLRRLRAEKKLSPVTRDEIRHALLVDRKNLLRLINITKKAEAELKLSSRGELSNMQRSEG